MTRAAGTLARVLAVAGFALALAQAALAGADPEAARWGPPPTFLGLPLLLLALALRAAARAEPPPEAAAPPPLWARLLALAAATVPYLLTLGRPWRGFEYNLIEGAQYMGRHHTLAAQLRIQDIMLPDAGIPVLRPLTWEIWTCIYALFGMAPEPYELFSLAGHGLAVWTLMGLVSDLGGGRRSALAAGVALGASPLAFEAAAVKFAAENGWSSASILLACRAYLAWLRGGRGRFAWGAGAWTAAAVGFYELGTTAVAFLGWLAFVGGSRKPLRARLAALLPALGATAIYLAGLAYVLLRNRPHTDRVLSGAYATPEVGTGWAPLPYEALVRLPNALAAVFGPGGAPSPTERLYWAAAAALVALAAWTSRAGRRRAGLAFGMILGGALLYLLPPLYRLSLIGPDLGHTRYLYLPAAGLALWIGLAAPRAGRAPAALLALAALAGAAAAPWTRAAALTPPSEAAFFEVCRVEMERAIAATAEGGKTILADPKPACRWAVFAQALPEARRAGREIVLYENRRWNGLGEREAVAAPALSDLRPGERDRALVPYLGEDAERVEDATPRLARARALRERFEAGDRFDALGEAGSAPFPGWFAPLGELPIQDGALRLGECAGCAETAVLSLPLDPAAFHALRIEAAASGVGARLVFFWTTGSPAHDEVFAREQAIEVPLRDGAAEIDLGARLWWPLTEDVRRVGLRASGPETLVRRIALYGVPPERP